MCNVRYRNMHLYRYDGSRFKCDIASSEGGNEGSICSVSYITQSVLNSMLTAPNQISSFVQSKGTEEIGTIAEVDIFRDQSPYYCFITFCKFERARVVVCGC